MHPIFRNILAVIAGVIIAMAVNGGVIQISSAILPPPDGVDPNNLESIKANMHLYMPKHFIMPFLAHALGSLVGAFAAAKIAVVHNMRFALAIGFFHLLGGIAAVCMLPSPLWFTLCDLLLAYIPMAYLGGWLANRE